MTNPLAKSRSVPQDERLTGNLPPPGGQVLPTPLFPMAQHLALTRAKTDEEAVAIWLAKCRSPKTFTSYKREAERLLFFCRERGITLQTLAYEDLLAFSAFLLNPPPHWISENQRKLPRKHPGWRPMIGPLAPGPHRTALTIVRKLLTWLKDAGYLQKNPGVLLELGRDDREEEITRYLPIEAFSFIDRAVEEMPSKSVPMLRQKTRARFLVSLYYETGIRLFEGAHACMGDVVRDYQGHWWLNVIGKGSSIKKPVPVSERLLSDLKEYRVAFDRSPLPAPGDPEPLILKARKAKAAAPGKTETDRVTEEGVSIALKAIFGAAARLADADDHAGLAELLRQATPHWLRHSCMSHLIDDGTDLPTVQAIARHKSISTTGRYLHKRKDDIHAAVSRRSEKRKAD